MIKVKNYFEFLLSQKYIHIKFPLFRLLVKSKNLIGKVKKEYTTKKVVLVLL